MGDLLFTEPKYRFALSMAWVTLGFPRRNIALLFGGKSDLWFPEPKYRFLLYFAWVISGSQIWNIALLVTQGWMYYKTIVKSTRIILTMRSVGGDMRCWHCKLCLQHEQRYKYMPFEREGACSNMSVNVRTYGENGLSHLLKNKWMQQPPKRCDLGSYMAELFILKCSFVCLRPACDH